MVKYGFLISALVLMSACASAPASKESSKEDANAALMRKMFLDNGEKMLCVQPDYVSCFKTTEAGCVATTSRYTRTCVDLAEKKVGKLSSRESYREFGKEFGGCMVTYHISSNSQNAKDIARCLKGMHYDANRAAKALMGK